MKDSEHRVILDSVADGVFTVDAQWVITSWNRAAAVITGFCSAEAIGKRCYEVFRADICREACALRQTMATGAEHINVHVRIRTHDGRHKPISVSTAVLRDGPEGEIVGGVETFRDLSALETLRRQLQDRYTFHDIIGKNHRMKELFHILPDIAQADSTVLIQGPTGSGKELFASALHSLSHRAHKPFVAVNCAAFPETLLEGELFGYRQGAFTEARFDKPGRFALADGGSLFLDEIGDMPRQLQAKLLRVLQQKVYEPLGATSPVAADVRIIAAANRDLSELMAEGRFREDLYYRLNVIALQIPPLRDRREDIPLLVDHFIQRFNAEKGREIEGVGREALGVLMAYDYPGNVRELESIVEHALVLSRGPIITRESLPQQLQPGVRQTGALSAGAGARVDASALDRAEADAIRQALASFQGHRARTAAALGLHKTTLIRKMRRLGISFPHCRQLS